EALCKGRSGEVTVTGTLGTRSAVAFDVDGDGDLDILTNEFNSEPQVFLSDLAQKRPIHWVKLRLVGTRSNRNGLGAAVRVTAGAMTQRQWMDGKPGSLPHSILPLYFGLGDAATIDRIEVAWPSGARQTLPGPIAGNRQIDVVEPGTAPARRAAPRRPGGR